jgi:hypothetical protein
LWIDVVEFAVSLDSCRFTPPWKFGYAEPYGIAYPDCTAPTKRWSRRQDT